VIGSVGRSPTEPPTFRREILGNDLSSEVPDVERETVSLIDEADRGKGHYRSDILLFWHGLNVHVEVKTCDPDLRKTWGEARHLRSKFPGEWRHFLLMLPAQKETDFRRVTEIHGNDVGDASRLHPGVGLALVRKTRVVV